MLHGHAPMPPSVLAVLPLAGPNTTGLGVAEHDALANTPDGAIPALGPGSHALTLYIAPSATLTPGTKLRVYVQRPDGQIDAGPTVAVD